MPSKTKLTQQAERPPRAFEEEVSRHLKERARLLLAAQTQVLQLLVTAKSRIIETLTGQPSDFQQWQLSRLLGQVNDVLDGAMGQAGALFALRMSDAWTLGEELIDKPLAAIGHSIEMVLPQLDVGVLKQMQAFGSLRLKDVGREVSGKIGQQLGMVTIGGQTPFEAIKEVQKLLDSDSPRRATAIVTTEVSRAFALASNERLAQAADLVPELGKQWRRSGKLHSRWNHDLIDGQVVGAREKFSVPNPGGGIDKMDCPHDPNAPVEQVIHCGCVMRPWKSTWKLTTPGAKPFSEKELAMDGRKAALEQARNRAGKNPE